MHYQPIVNQLCVFICLCLPFLQRSTEQMRKIPTIVLSITYKGVKFIDAANKVTKIHTHHLKHFRSRSVCISFMNIMNIYSFCCRTSSQSTRSVTYHVQPRIQRTCVRLPTSLKTCRPATITAMSSVQ